MYNKLPRSPEIDDRRVTSIRSKLDEDAYVVNSRQIADKIIDIELALSEASKPSTRCSAT